MSKNSIRGIIADLRSHNVNLQEFGSRLKALNPSEAFNKATFERLYGVYRACDYAMPRASRATKG